jgi:hypothetical protein
MQATHVIKRAAEHVADVAVCHHLCCQAVIELLGLAEVRRCVLRQVLVAAGEYKQQQQQQQ